MKNESYLIKQKSMNSFQSILLLEVKHFNWHSEESKTIIEHMLMNINDNNPYISKAAAQCLLSLCKVDGIKFLANNLSFAYLSKLKAFVEDTTLKMPGSQIAITVDQI